MRRLLHHPATPVIAAAVVAFASAAFDLERRSMWADEAESLRFSQSLRAMIEDWNAFFYYVVLWLIRRGEIVELFWLRLPSAVAFGVTAGAAVALFARLRPASGAAARLAVGLAVAAHPLLLTLAQDARGYSLGMALLALAALALLALVDTGRARHALLVAPLAVAAVYCQLLIVVFVAVALAGAFLVARGRRLAVALTGAAIAVGVAPIVHNNLFTKSANRLWWVKKPSLENLIGFFGELGGGWGTLYPFGWLTLALMAWCATLRDDGRGRRALARLVLAVAALPVLLGVARSFWSPSTMPKFWMFCVPFAVVWVGARLDGALPSAARRVGLALAAVCGGLWIAGSALNHLRGKNEGWREAYELVRAQSRPGDRIWLPFVSGPFLYYAAKDGLPGLVPLGPCTEWVSPITLCKQRAAPPLFGFRRGRGRVWVIINRGAYKELEALKGTGMRLILTKQLLTYPFSGRYADPKGGIVEVNLFERDR